jgi:hypothetical protein
VSVASVNPKHMDGAVRRKILQHCANNLVRTFLDLPSGYDIALCAKYRRGELIFDFPRGSATVNGEACPEPCTGERYREWLLRELATHRIPVDALRIAKMTARFEVKDNRARHPDGVTFLDAYFSFDCESELTTDEKSYTCRGSHAQAWGCDYHWEKLFGGT